MLRIIQNNKIGNLLNYLSSKIDDLSMTKAIKLLYLIDESSIKKSGSPITWLLYKAWENGPVPVDIYEELRYERINSIKGVEISLKDFIRIERKESQFRPSQIEIYIYPKKDYDLSEFSEFELDIINIVIDKYGSKSAKDLIKILHSENSVWHKTVIKHGLKSQFAVYGSKSDYSVNFFELIKDDPFLISSAKSAYESLAFSSILQENNCYANA